MQGDPTTAGAAAMRPLADWPQPARHGIRGVMTDIDDTLTADGHIVPAALHALHALHAHGYRLIAITGRPAGWCEPYAAHWPVDAIVAENGAMAFVRQAGDAPPARLYQQPQAQREANYQKMQAVAQHILQQVPRARLASDSAGRECDIAIDHSEHHQLDAAEIAQVVACMRQAGMQATVSSIHINGWYGEHNKWQGANWIVHTLLQRSLQDELDQWVYVGDSTNDERMFEHFKHSVGVANIARFAPLLKHLPQYVAERERGAGFAEMAQALLDAAPQRV